MQESDKAKKPSAALIWSVLVLCLGCVVYLRFKHWLFLAGGIMGFALIFVSGD